MILSAFDAQGDQIDFETYYSVGGGFVATAEQLQQGTSTANVAVTYPFTSADQMLRQAEKHGLSIGG